MKRAAKAPAKGRKRVTTRAGKRGRELLNQVIALTGIPSKTIHQELKAILDRKNIDINELTLEQLRGAVATYLREIMGGLLDKAGTKKIDLNH